MTASGGTTLGFWAQALDNRSPDLMRLGGKDLPPGHPSRDEVASRASDISMHGDLLHQTEAVRLTARGDAFLLVVVPEAKDVDGRLSPISIVGRGLPSDPRDVPALVEHIRTELTAFASSSGRPLQSALSAALRQAFEASAQKKKPSTRLVITAVLILAAFFAAWVVFSSSP